MPLFDLLGALLTLITLGLLGLGGYLLALRLLGREGEEDPLALAIATLVLSTGGAMALAMVLGALGLLRLDLALTLLALGVILLLREERRRDGDARMGRMGRLLLSRAWERIVAYPALSLLTLHAIGSEALRGLLRPPLSWDSLMYHLFLAATWLQEQDLQPVLGQQPLNFYGYFPANGSLWLWWWLAPSHSEFYVNLAFLPQWALLGLAVAGVARHLGARRHWPVAGFLTLLTPTVLRFAATQYVDILLASTLLAGAYFGFRWMARPGWRDALLTGLALGIAGGTKVIGLPYLAVLAGTLLVFARRPWKPRLGQVALALAAFLALGVFFYVRNVVHGVGAFALECEGPHMVDGGSGLLPDFPRRYTVLASPGHLLRHGILTDVFLGVARPESMELGVGPQALILLVAALALPFALGGHQRRAALVAAIQILAQLCIWVAVPYAAEGHIFANVRYLIGGIGFAFAGALAVSERLRMEERWLRGIALVLAIQSLLQLHAEMPRQVRIAMAFADLGAVALALSPGLREMVQRRWRPLAAAGLAVALLGAPFLAQFRVRDRGRAFAREFTAHLTSTRLFASAWRWLDRHGGQGTVAVVMEPGSDFVYPAMGPYFERRALYININRENHPEAGLYPQCDPRVNPSAEAWLENLTAAGVHWLLVSRYPKFDFPMENRWAEAHPRHFRLRYQDLTNRIYEFSPSGTWEEEAEGEDEEPPAGREEEAEESVIGAPGGAAPGASGPGGDPGPG